MARIATALLLLAVLCPLEAEAQPLWISPSAEDNITLEGHKPLFSESEGLTFLTSAWHLSGRFGVTPRLQLVGEVGVSHFGQDIVEVDGAVFDEIYETAIGNVFLGATYFPEVAGLSITLGARLPTATDNFGGTTGIYSEPYRYEAFIIDYTSVLVEADYLLRIDEQVSLRAAARPSLHFDHFETDPGDRGGTDLGVRYALQGWYETDQLRGAVGLTGSSSLLTGLHMGLQDPTVIAFGAALSARLNTIEPGLTVLVPITEDYSQVVDAVLGLSVRIPLQ